MLLRNILGITLIAALSWGGVSFSASAQEELGKLPDFRLMDQFGYSHQARRYVDMRGVVLMAVPMQDQQLEENVRAFRSLATRYGAEGVQFFMIAPSPIAGAPGAASGGLPVLLDETQMILPKLGLDHAYQCLIAESTQWDILYRGNLDSVDGAPGLAEALAGLNDGTMAPTSVPASGRELKLLPLPEDIAYSKDIAPILEQHCVQCHSEGNAGPFAMSSHRKVRGWAEMMAETIRTDRMPPWNADPAYGHWRNENRMTPVEKRRLLAWLDAGAPSDGTAGDPLTQVTPAVATDWQLGTPDLVVKLPEPQVVPADGLQDYRYYEVPIPGSDQARWLRGAEIRVTEPEVVHHVLAFLNEPGRGIDLEGEYLASYVPGHVHGMYPPNTGKPLPPGASILFQLHYTPTGKRTVDETELGLYFHDAPPEHELFLGSAINKRFEIPPNSPDHVVEASFHAPDDILVYTLSPHMHYRGSRMHYEAHYPNGEMEVLLSVPNYDFYWQHTYVFDEPKRLPRGTRVRVVGAFDNSVRNPLNPNPNTTLYWGDQSVEEMFIGSLLYRVDRQG